MDECALPVGGLDGIEFTRKLRIQLLPLIAIGLAAITVWIRLVHNMTHLARILFFSMLVAMCRLP